jgi:hypothetical protein
MTNQNPNNSENLNEDPPFFEVSEKTVLNSNLVSPKITFEQEQKNLLNDQPSAIQVFLKLHKTLLIILGLCVLLIYPIYLVINKYLLPNPEPENFLVTPLTTNPPSKDTTVEKGFTQTTGEWQIRFFGSDTCLQTEQCGDSADPDKDGLENLSEFKLLTDPNNKDSDQDGLADGDEVKIFNSDPNKTSTASDEKYNDGQYLRGGYDVLVKDKLLTQEQISQISDKLKLNGIHSPTEQTLGDSLLKLYNFSQNRDLNNLKNTTTTPISTNPLDGLETTVEAKQDRDTQRSTTIKNLAIALVKYFNDKKAYPASTDFSKMYSDVKIYSRVAINPLDPVNKDKFVYSYKPETNNQDFTLTFFSETQNQNIKTKSSDGKKYIELDQSAIYDDQRKTNLETLRSALLLYSSQNISGNAEYVFPTKEELAKALVPKLIGEIPKDPKNNEAYDYQVSEDFESFTLKALLDAPPIGKSGYLCNQEECRVY